MKKVWITSAAIVLLLLIFVYGYLQFRESSSYQNRIHQGAALVFKINVDGIFKTMSADFLSHPGYYLSQDEVQREKRGFGKGISLPANIFVYTLNSRSAQTYFCALPVSDSAALGPYLKRVFKLTDLRKEPQGTMIGTSADQKFTVLYNARHLAVAYSFKKEKVLDILYDLLEERNLLAGTEPLMETLKHQKAHVSWTFQSHSGAVNFKDGAVIAQGTFPVGSFQIPDQIDSRVDFTKDAALKVWLQMGFNPAADQKLVNIKDFSLQTDTVLKYYGGYADLELGSPLIQKDSVITYEYNDEFEKVAQVTLKEDTVPHLRITFRANSQPLFHYLKSREVLTENNQLNKKLFPLYQVFSKSNPETGQFSTMEQEGLTSDWAKSPYFFFAAIDFNKIRKDRSFPLLNEYLNSYIGSFARLKATAVKKDQKTAVMEIKIDFQRKDINAFTQLIN